MKQTDEYGRCIHCGMKHDYICHRVSAITFGSDGKTVLRVEYFPPEVVLMAPPLFNDVYEVDWERVPDNEEEPKGTTH